MIPETMKAVVLTEPVRGDEVSLTEYPVPKVRPGWVLVKVKAFGMNHSEQILRQGEIRADYIQKPLIPGIECVGEIADPSDSSFKKGQKVAALMGGMGRSFNGSYGEYALLPVHHVFSVVSSLSRKEKKKLWRVCSPACSSCVFRCFFSFLDRTCRCSGDLFYRLGVSF